MAQYTCSLFANQNAWLDVTVEADTPAEAVAKAIAEAKTKPSHAWDSQDIQEDSIDCDETHLIPPDPVEI
jgi:hypothetical protein